MSKSLLFEKKQNLLFAKMKHAHRRRGSWPASFVTPIHPHSPAWLHIPAYSMCAYSADLNFRLHARHTERPRPLPPLPPFSNAQQRLCLLLRRTRVGHNPWMVQSTHLHPCSPLHRWQLQQIAPHPHPLPKLCLHLLKVRPMLFF